MFKNTMIKSTAMLFFVYYYQQLRQLQPTTPPPGDFPVNSKNKNAFI